ncbi:molecular chaperone DnaK [Halobacteriales archaeon SW_7_68_16]|nr:MAG: molecular chaperone DnaK [Halobacteriales archaeon SW_7_68_16]
MTDDRTLGIDLGTTRSAMAHVADEDADIIENAEGDMVTPSIVHLTADGESLVGGPAEDQMVMKPDRTVAEIKKEMGEDVTVELDEESYSPQEVSAMILQKLVEDAEDRLGEGIGSAVITVPAYFSDRQRTATREAGEMAGLAVKKLLPEPSAAVLAYGMREQKLGEAENETIFVYDLGGGTFDATLVEAKYEANIIETIATDGDTALGGSDWTDAIADWLFDRIEDDTDVDLRTEDALTEQRNQILTKAREAKHRLSEQSTVTINQPFAVPQQGHNLEAELTREEFEDLTAPLLDRTTAPMDDIFERTDYDVDDVDKVLLIGGSTRMPQVETLVADYFGQDPSKEISPDKAVAMGAAIQSAVIEDVSGLPGGDDGGALIDALPQSIGVEVQPGDRFDPIVERDTSIPTTERKEGYSVESAQHTSVEIRVYQGESSTIHNNEHLGTAKLENIPRRQPGDESIAIEFAVDEDGTLEVRGEDMKSGAEIETAIDRAIGEGDGDGDHLPSNS